MNRHDARWTRASLERLRRVMPGLHGTMPRFFVRGTFDPDADLRDTLRKVEASCKDGRTPLVVAYDGEDASPIVVMRFPRFLELVLEWWQGQHQP